MAIIYWDPLSGDDTLGDGLSFATAFKSLGKCHTVAVDGDEIRVKKTNDPTAASVSATWTNQSENIVISSAVSSDICTFPGTTWNVTGTDGNWCTADSTLTKADGRRYLSFQLTPSPGFGGTPVGTHRWAYQATTFTNYAGYEQVSFLLKVTIPGLISTGPFAGQQTYKFFEVRLCSDTAGNVPVHTIPFPQSGTSSQFTIPVVVNLGVSIGAIQSIAIYANSSYPGYVSNNFGEQCQFHISNMIACKSVSDPSVITHQTLITKNTLADRRLYPLRYIEGTTLTIGNSFASTLQDSWSSFSAANSLAHHRYPGVSEVVPLYTLCLNRPGDFYTDTTASDGLKTFSKSLSITGSWIDEITASTGYTWFAPSTAPLTNNPPQYFSLIGSTGSTYRNYNFYRLGFYGFTNIVRGTGASFTHSYTFDTCLGAGNGQLFFLSATNGTSPTLRMINTYFGNCEYVYQLNNSVTNGWGRPLYFHNSDVYNIYKGIAIAYNCKLIEASLCRFSNLTERGFRATESRFKGYAITHEGNASFPIPLVSANTFAVEQMQDVVIDQLTTNVSYDLFTYSGEFPVRVMRYNGNNNDHRTYYGKKVATPSVALSTTTPVATVTSDGTANRHTLTGVAWKLSPLDSTYFNMSNPLEIPIVKIVVANLNPITVSVWVKRDNTGISGRLILPANQAGALASDLIADYASPAGTYTQLSITFTPTLVNTVLEVFFQAWGGSTFNIWVDDMTVT